MRVKAIYFSATFTTRRIVEIIATNISNDIEYFDITNTKPSSDTTFSADDLVIFGIPVYAGRVPEIARQRILSFKGNNTPAIAIAVYGNRHYEDALLELYDLLKGLNFKIISAGAFIAQHSIFPKVATSRPDKIDFEKITEFTSKSKKLINIKCSNIEIPGNRPYKIPGDIPIWPTGSKRCNSCGICVKKCPTGAIDPNSPRSVNRQLCIKCGRCVAVCPTKSRRFYGIKYSLAAAKFNLTFSQRREPEMFYAE